MPYYVSVYYKFLAIAYWLYVCLIQCCLGVCWSVSFSCLDKDGNLKVLLSQYAYEKCRPTLNSHSLRDLLCPSLQSSDLQEKRPPYTPEEILEWLGAINLNVNWWVLCGINRILNMLNMLIMQYLHKLGNWWFCCCSENSATSFLSTYTCPEPCSSISQALLCTVTGLVPPEDISALLQELRYV